MVFGVAMLLILVMLILSPLSDFQVRYLTPVYESAGPVE